MRLNILYLTTEIYPYIKTGGLADYSDSLTKSLSNQKDVSLKILVPGYPVILNAISRSKIIMEGKTLINPSHRYKLIECEIKKSPITYYVLDIPQLYQRVGNPYLDSSGNEWSDNFERFATFSSTPYLMFKNNIDNLPNVVHANDWHTGLCPAYLNLLGTKKPKTVFTIHNAAFQGIYPKTSYHKLNLPKSYFDIQGMEYFEKISFMKAGVNFSDEVVTVSPRYAWEMLHDKKTGMGFSGILRNKGTKFSGILNGVDYSVWSPNKDKYINIPYNKNHLSLKKKNKTIFQKDCGFEEDGKQFLISTVTRLSDQKGLDLLHKSLEETIRKKPNIQFVCIGTGDKKLENAYENLERIHPKQVKFYKVYSEALAHLTLASSDAFIMPSRFEPCGLTQLYALRYGAIPIVTPVGGLFDTVSPIKSKASKILGNGFICSDISVGAISESIDRALELFSNQEKWTMAMLNGMRKNFSWTKSAKKYLNLYKNI